MSTVCPVCTGSGQLLEDTCPLCDGDDTIHGAVTPIAGSNPGVVQLLPPRSDVTCGSGSVSVQVRSIAGVIIFGPKLLDADSTVGELLCHVLEEQQQPVGAMKLLHDRYTLEENETIGMVATRNSAVQLELTLVRCSVPVGANTIAELSVWSQATEDESRGKLAERNQHSAALGSITQELFGRHLSTGEIFMFKSEIGHKFHHWNPGHPVSAGNKIYMRYGSEMFCYSSGARGKIFLRLGTCKQADALYWEDERTVALDEVQEFMYRILVAVGCADFDDDSRNSQTSVWATFVGDLGIKNPAAWILCGLCSPDIKHVPRLNESHLVPLRQALLRTADRVRMGVHWTG